MTARPDAALLAAARLLENAASKVPAARQHLRREQLILDGMPTTASGADRDPGGGHGQTIRVRIDDPDGNPVLNDRGEPQYDWVPVTGVEATVFRLDRLNDHADDLLAQVRGIVTMIHNINRDCDRILGTRLADTPRCSSEGRDGAGEWGVACSNVPSRGPLCDRCAKAEYRWRTRNGKEPRRDGVFSADQAGAA